MKRSLKDQILGSIFLFIFVAIPLGFIFTPFITLAFAIGALWGIATESHASATPQKRKVQSRKPKPSKDDEELITAILPVINGKK